MAEFIYLTTVLQQLSFFNGYFVCGCLWFLLNSLKTLKFRKCSSFFALPLIWWNWIFQAIGFSLTIMLVMYTLFQSVTASLPLTAYLKVSRIISLQSNSVTANSSGLTKYVRYSRVFCVLKWSFVSHFFQVFPLTA